MNPPLALMSILAQRLHLGLMDDEKDVLTLPEVVSLAMTTKTDGLLYRNIVADPGSAIAKRKAFLIKSNLEQLGWTIKLQKALQDGGVEAVAFKGCLRAQEVYGIWGMRQSSDIDLLVRKGDYWTACEILEDAGFDPIVSRKSRWWHEHLGEAPFVSRDGSNVVVDLHNSIQQPGGPYPRELGLFFKGARVHRFGSASVTALSQEDALLVCAINYGKAVRAGAPWLAQAHELATCHAQMSASDKKTVQEYAERQGVVRLYEEAVRQSQLLFGGDLPSADSQILRSAFGSLAHTRFSRTRALWAWSDGVGANRSIRFADLVRRVIQRDISQFVEDRNGLRHICSDVGVQHSA